MTEALIIPQIDESTIAELPAQSIGKILRQKREELNIDPLAVGTFLRVKLSDITAIENGDLDGVTKHIYVLGLIRSYAKFLKIAPEIIEEKIRLLTVKSNTDNKKHLLINIGEDPHVTPSKDSFFNFLLISILLFLVLLSLYNFYENNDSLITNKNIIHEFENIDS